MMTQHRIVSVVGARPQFVKLAPVAHALTSRCEHVVIHTGQHYDVLMSDVFFADLEIPDPDLHLGIGSGTHAAQTAEMMVALETALLEQDPTWVLVYGDTNSTLAATLAAVKQHLPVAHLEAGLRSHNREMPEEHNRVLTDHAADLLLAPTENAYELLRFEGLADRSTVVGDVMADVCLQIRDATIADPMPFDAPSEFVLATLHRPSNTDDPWRLRAIVDALAALDITVVVPAHPRLRAKANAAGIELERDGLVVVDPLPYPGLVRAVVGAAAVATDSGGLQKEAFLLETPCTTIRTETEWVETLTDGWNVLCPDPDGLPDAVARACPTRSPGFPFGRGQAAQSVADVLLR